MNPEDKKLLEKTYDLARDNHKILKKMRAHERRRQIIHAIKWLIIIAVLVFLYSVAQPYIQEVRNMYQDISSGVEEVKDFGGLFSGTSTEE